MINTNYLWKTLSNKIKSTPIEGYRKILLEITNNMSSEEIYKYIDYLEKN